MKIEDLKGIAYSNHGFVQWAVVYDCNSQKDVLEGTVESAISEYGECELTRLQADQDYLVFEVRL